MCLSCRLALCDVFHTPVPQYSLFVLKTPLNTNQLTNWLYFGQLCCRLLHANLMRQICLLYVCLSVCMYVCRRTTVTYTVSCVSSVRPRQPATWTLAASSRQSLFIVWTSRRKTNANCDMPSGQRVRTRQEICPSGLTHNLGKCCMYFCRNRIIWAFKWTQMHGCTNFCLLISWTFESNWW